MAQALYRKWRPQRWDDVIGQNHVIQTLRNAVASDRVAHAYLFAGPRGTGKTTTARLLAKAVNCLDPDLTNRPCDRCENCQAVHQGRFLDMIEIDAASNTSVDDVRDLRDKINFSPNIGRYKIYIIDEVHMLSTAAFNALLKTLEEPPAHAIFILATTEVHKIPATVLSRCQRHEFRRIPVPEIVEHLRKLATEEKLSVDGEALNLIARQSTGCLRDAISLLDQLSSTSELINLETAHQVLGTATNQAVVELINCLLAGDAGGGLEQIHRALDTGSDPRQFARQIVEYLRGLLLSKMGGGDQLDETIDIRNRMAQQALVLEKSHLLHLIRAFNQAANELRTSWQPALPLEIAFIEALNAPPAAIAPVPVVAIKAPEKEANTPAAGRPAQEQRSTPPVAAQTQPEASPPVDGESTQAYDQINAGWRNVIDLVNQQSKQTAAILRSAKLLGMRRGVLILGFEGDLLKQKMEAEEHLQRTQRVISEFVSRDILVRCIALRDRQSAIPPDVDIDGMVAAALRDLGGKIVDIQ